MKKWTELGHDNAGHIFPTYYYWRSVQIACRVLEHEPEQFGIWFNNTGFSWMTKQGSLKEAGNVILQRLEKDSSFIEKIKQDNETKILPMLRASEFFLQDLTEISGEELYRRYKIWEDLFLNLMRYSIMGTILEFEEPLLSNRVLDILKQKVPNYGELFGDLTLLDRRTTSQQEKIDFLKIKLQQLEGSEVEGDLLLHHQKYAWIPYNYDGPGWSLDDLRKRLNEISDDKNELLAKIEEINQLPLERKRRNQEIQEELNLSAHEKYLCDMLRELGYWKFERKLLNSKSHWMLERLFKEIARRNSIALEDAKSISPMELRDALQGEIDLPTLKSRQDFLLIEFDGYEGIEFFTDMSKQREIENDIAVDETISDVTGTVAFPGIVRGNVRIVNTVEDMTGFCTGEILVSISTSPEITPAMQKAAAIVTDSGGITCHAAIVARELGVPTIVGTKVASRVLRDGDLVEVDADKGIVRKLQ